MNLNERLDKVKELVQNDDFLAGRGLSNEVNIRIFCYDPKEEMAIRHFMEKMNESNLACNLKEIDLYELFLNILEEKKILKAIPSQELKKGKDFIKKQFDKIIDAKTMASKMKYEPHCKGDVIVLTGVGKIFPFMRVHALLEAMQPLFEDVPILVMYPGEYDGHYVKLFNKLKPNEYYRAFRTI